MARAADNQQQLLATTPAHPATPWLRNRWLCLAGGACMVLCAGSVYGFGAFAEDLELNLGLSSAEQSVRIHPAHAPAYSTCNVGSQLRGRAQAQIALCGNLGLWAGSFSGGILADAKGPKVTLLGGALFLLVGYGGIHLALSSTVSRFPSTLRAQPLPATDWR